MTTISSSKRVLGGRPSNGQQASETMRHMNPRISAACILGKSNQEDQLQPNIFPSDESANSQSKNGFCINTKN